MPRMEPRAVSPSVVDRSGFAAKVATAGAAALCVGSFLPWAQVSSVFGTVSRSGTSGDGWFTAVVGVLAAIAFWVGSVRSQRVWLGFGIVGCVFARSVPWRGRSSRVVAKLPVDSLGKVYNNASDARLSSGEVAGWRESKLGVLGKYKFTIAFENREFVGYTTEKLVDAWLADTVPIYWGNPAFVVHFPDDACLSLYQAGSMARLVEHEQLRSRNPFRTGEGQAALERYRTGIVPFAENIRAAALEHRSRRRRFGRREARRLAVRPAGRPLSRVAARVNTLDLHRGQ